LYAAQPEFQSSRPSAYGALEEIVREGNNDVGISLLPRAHVDPLSLLNLQQNSLQALKAIERDSVLNRRYVASIPSSEFSNTMSSSTPDTSSSYQSQPITVDEEEELTSRLGSMNLSRSRAVSEESIDDEDSDEEKNDIIGEAIKMSHIKLKDMAMKQPLTVRKTLESIKHNQLAMFAKSLRVHVGRGRPAVLAAILGWHDKQLLREEKKKAKAGRGVEAACALKLTKKQLPSRTQQAEVLAGEERAGNDNPLLRDQLKSLLHEMKRTGELC